MTATLTTRIVWDVLMDTDAGTTSLRFVEVEDAASLVRYLNAKGTKNEVQRVEVAIVDMPKLGIAQGSEWLATSSLVAGNVWKRATSLRKPHTSYRTAAAVRGARYVAQRRRSTLSLVNHRGPSVAEFASGATAIGGHVDNTGVRRTERAKLLVSIASISTTKEA